MSHEARPGAFHIVTPLNDRIKGDVQAGFARQAGIPTRAVTEPEVEAIRRMFDGGVVVDPFIQRVHSKYIRGRRAETEQ